MDYERNRRYTQKSNTGFWLIGLFTVLLSGYMAYNYFMEFANAGYNAADSYVYGLGNTIDPSKRISTSSVIILYFIYGVLFLSLMIASIISSLMKNFKSLGICFLLSITLSVVIFFIDEILLN